MLYLLRFFVVAPPLPSMMGWTFAVTAVAASALLILDPAQGRGAMLPVLVLQLFAAASGFSGSARRGYYDLLLTSGESRLRVAIAHWFMSINRGVAAWLVLGIVEIAASRSTQSAILSGGSVAAMFTLSTMPWALSVAQPRFAASIGWLLLLTMGTVVVPDGNIDGWLQSAPGGLGGVVTAVTYLVYPPALIGRPLTWPEVLPVLPGLGIALGSLGASWWWIARADYPLEASQ